MYFLQGYCPVGWAEKPFCCTGYNFTGTILDIIVLTSTSTVQNLMQTIRKINNISYTFAKLHIFAILPFSGSKRPENSEQLRYFKKSCSYKKNECNIKSDSRRNQKSFLAVKFHSLPPRFMFVRGTERVYRRL